MDWSKPIKKFFDEQLKNACKEQRQKSIQEVEEFDRIKNNGSITLARLNSLKANKVHLQWIYDRMVNVHKENENYDYMHKFKEIIDSL